MKMIAPVFALFVLSTAAQAQVPPQPAEPNRIPCKLKLNVNFSKWDDRTIDAVSGEIDKYQSWTPHVSISTVFPRSGSNIRWRIDLNETHYSWTESQGHLVQAQAVYFNRNQENERHIVYGSSPESYEAAVKIVMSKALRISGVEQVAIAEGGCPLISRPALKSAPARGPSSIAAEPAVTHIRVMTANISSGNRQNYNNGDGIRIFQGLKPDVVMIQEFNYKSNSNIDLEEMITTAFDETFSFFRESEDSDKIPNGIISRFPIHQKGEWTDQDMPDRDFAWAQIDIPGEPYLWAISVHLSSSKPAVRLKEAETLKTLIRKIPKTDYVVLGGDFNIQNRDDIIVRTLADEVFEREAPSDSQNRTTTNMTNKKNYDWILNDSDLAQYQVATSFKSSKEEVEIALENVYPHGLVFDSTTFPLLDRVSPIEKEDSRAPGMQHLAVVKDYEVPAPEAATVTPPAEKPATDSTGTPRQTKRRWWRFW